MFTHLEIREGAILADDPTKEIEKGGIELSPGVAEKIDDQTGEFTLPTETILRPATKPEEPTAYVTPPARPQLELSLPRNKPVPTPAEIISTLEGLKIQIETLISALRPTINQPKNEGRNFPKGRKNQR